MEDAPDGDPVVSDDIAETAEALERFRKRHMDAQFRVVGPAPAWALKRLWGKPE